MKLLCVVCRGILEDARKKWEQEDAVDLFKPQEASTGDTGRSGKDEHPNIGRDDDGTGSCTGSDS